MTFRLELTTPQGPTGIPPNGVVPATPEHPGPVTQPGLGGTDGVDWCQLGQRVTECHENTDPQTWGGSEKGRYPPPLNALDGRNRKYP